MWVCLSLRVSTINVSTVYDGPVGAGTVRVNAFTFITFRFGSMRVITFTVGTKGVFNLGLGQIKLVWFV